MVSQMDNEEMYTEALEFQIAGASGEPPVTLTWDPEAGIGSGDDFKDTLALTSLDYFIRTYDEEYSGEYSVTPEGPTFQTNPKDLRMVVWSINQLFEGGIVSATGKYPTLTDMGLTEASNYDANGREIIR
jgi:hypothetical protein